MKIVLVAMFKGEQTRLTCVCVCVGNCGIHTLMEPGVIMCIVSSLPAVWFLMLVNRSYHICLITLE